MAVSTTIHAQPALEHAFTLAAAALDESAREHKRLSALHRRRSQTARQQLDALRTNAARAGVVITISEGE